MSFGGVNFGSMAFSGDGFSGTGTVAQAEPAPRQAGGLLQALEQRFAMLHDPGDPLSLRSPEGLAVLAALLDALEQGRLQVVERVADGSWWVHAWIRTALMAYIQASAMQVQRGGLPGSEMDLLGWSDQRPLDRRVPSGSYIRRGVHLGLGCTVMPPSTIQAGAFVAKGVLVDAHCMIGSCVRLEEGVRVGCGTMIGGFLTPADLLPTVLERGVVVGGNCGFYGAILVGEGTRIEAGTVVRSTGPVYDERSEAWLRPDGDGVLRLPPGVQVCMGLPPSLKGVPRLAPVVCNIESG